MKKMAQFRQGFPVKMKRNGCILERGGKFLDYLLVDGINHALFQ
jgi:hypothetical protein